MKKICLLGSALLMVSATINAQSVYDITKFSNTDLEGTSRFIGMGGAMGALGGDISTIATNPAGLGIYRSNDLMMTFGATDRSAKATFNNSSSNNDRSQGTFDNLGFVYSARIGTPRDAVQFVNFGFNYRRSQNLFGNMTTNQSLNNTSLIEEMGSLAQNSGYYPKSGQEDFTPLNENISWLSMMGVNTGAINYSDSDYTAPNLLTNNYSLTNEYYSRERGGIDAYDIATAINIRDRIYLGLTLSLYDIDYSKYSAYAEYYNGSNNPYMNLQSWNKYTGSGWDLKLGTIIRPIESSSFRIGLAVHTPTFYNLTNTTSSHMESNLSGKDYYSDTEEYLTQQGYDPDVDFDYKIRTPWVFDGSLGYIIGNNLALGAEYEYRDFGAAKMYDKDGNNMFVNDTQTFNDRISSMLTHVNTYRIGAEYKVIPEFALRAGFTHSDGIYNSDAYKQLSPTSITTDPDYANINSQNSFSFGFGYHGRNFYADVAYLYTHYSSDFHPFADPDRKDFANANLSTVKYDTNNFKITLGYRF